MAGTGLKLNRTGVDAGDTGTARRMEEPAPRVLKFPGAVRDVVGPPDPNRIDAGALAEQALRRMQVGLDALHREFDPDWHGPRAA